MFINIEGYEKGLITRDTVQVVAVSKDRVQHIFTTRKGARQLVQCLRALESEGRLNDETESS